MIRWKWICAGLAVLLLALQATLWIGQGSIAEVIALQRQIDGYRESNAALRERNQRLEVEVQEFKSGLDSVEEMAREELGMIREDETFYLLVSP